MPVVAVANCRSLEPKIKSVTEKIENEQIDLMILVEVWEKTGKKQNYFKSKMEELAEMKGLKYISCGARPSGKRGGGAGILVNLKKFSIDALEIHVPHNLEVKWGIMRPKKVDNNSKYNVFLICSFYSPPASKKHKKLLDHLVSTTHALLAKYPRAAVILGADKNSLPLAPLLQALPRFKQIVTQPTHGDKIIDVIIMNCADMYAVVEVGDPVLPDNPRQAKPSDHKVPVARPLATASRPVSNEYTVKTYRPLPESAVREFLAWIHAEQWGELAIHSSPSEQVDVFQNIVNAKVEELFPERKVKLSQQDKQFITSEIKSLDRQKKKEWKQHGKSAKYKHLKQQFDEKYKKAASNYLSKAVSNLKIENPGKAAKTLKKMGASPGDCDDSSSFTLQNHIEEGLSVKEQLARFSDYFIAVSQEFPPLQLDQLSAEARRKLSEIRQEEIPQIHDYEIFHILDKSNKKKSMVPGDMPPRLFYASSAGLAAPAASIMNRIAQTGEWPKQYQTEWGVPLEKIKGAQEESQTRLISCTNKMNIVLEKQVVKWLMEYVEHQLDPDQFGGMKGNSISHYMIELTNFILYNQDLKDPQSIIAAFLDFRQGFNRCQHSIFIDILANDYSVPGWLLRILVGYLTGRHLKVRYKGEVGEEKDIFGGGAQGAPLGMWIFLFMIDKAGPKTNPAPLGQIITQPLKKRKRMETAKKKWIDDFTILAAIDFKNVLANDPAPVRPVPFRSRTGHILPENNSLQHEVDLVKTYSQERKMLLNPLKTKTMVFNTLLKYDVLPQISTQAGEYLDVVEEHKILGFVLRSDLKTISNTEYICQKAYKRMWLIRRLKTLGCPIPELIEVLKQQIVSICEFGAAYWGCMITKTESNMLERCLKTGLHIIFQEQYITFSQCLKLAKISSLKERRLAIIARFSKNAQKNPKYKKWFCASEEPADEARTRQAGTRPLLKPVQCRTQRYERSPLPVMTRLLSWHPPLPYTPLHLA